MLSTFLRRRSSGIRDLRQGSLVDEDWRDRDPEALRAAACEEVPLLEGATHCFVSATVTRSPRHPLGRVVGDTLVLRRAPRAAAARASSGSRTSTACTSARPTTSRCSTTPPSTRSCGSGCASRLPARPRHPDALEGQRRLRARQQRRVLLVLRHRDQPLADHGGRPRHPRRRGGRAVRGVALRVQGGADVPGPRARRAARRAPGPLERALRDRPVPRGRPRAGRGGLVRARLRRPRRSPPARDPGARCARRSRGSRSAEQLEPPEALELERVRSGRCTSRASTASHPGQRSVRPGACTNMRASASGPEVPQPSQRRPSRDLDREQLCRSPAAALPSSMLSSMVILLSRRSAPS